MSMETIVLAVTNFILLVYIAWFQNKYLSAITRLVELTKAKDVSDVLVLKEQEKEKEVHPEVKPLEYSDLSDEDFKKTINY